MRSLLFSIISSLLLCFSFGLAHADERVTITSYSNDYKFASGNIGCPQGEWGDAFVVDINRLGEQMDLQDYEKLFDLIERYEREHQIDFRSKTRAQEIELIADRIRTEATGPVDRTGTALCLLLAKYI